MPARRRYRFFGRVQGVGFRYRARYAALQLGLTGWVENQPDGTVLLEAQGDAAQLDKLVRTITDTSRWIMVENVEITTLTPLPTESAFRVLADY